MLTQTEIKNFLDILIKAETPQLYNLEDSLLKEINKRQKNGNQ